MNKKVLTMTDQQNTRRQLTARTMAEALEAIKDTSRMMSMSHDLHLVPTCIRSC